jgi:hypothetical protein
MLKSFFFFHLMSLSLFAVVKYQIKESDSIHEKYWKIQNKIKKNRYLDFRNKKYESLKISNEFITNGELKNINSGRVQKHLNLDIINNKNRKHPCLNITCYNDDYNKKDVCIISYASLVDHYISGITLTLKERI